MLLGRRLEKTMWLWRQSLSNELTVQECPITPKSWKRKGPAEAQEDLLTGNLTGLKPLQDPWLTDLPKPINIPTAISLTLTKSG